MHPSGKSELLERGLAAVGFLALVALGIWLAIYSSRFIPQVVESVGSAATSLSSVFRAAEPTLTVVPNGTSTPSTDITTESQPSVSTVATTTSSSEKPRALPTPSRGQQTGAVFPISTTTKSINTLYGLPDLVTTITATGYLSSATTTSFTASSTVPAGMRPAVKFVVKNIGTNSTPTSWHFSASIPTSNSYVFYSPNQPSLNPGDSVEYTLGFDQAAPGVNRSISIIADSITAIAESNENNNSAIASLTILAN